MSNPEILGRFVWHELLTTDTAGAAAFYPKVVPWRTAPSNMPGYTIWMAGQAQVGGLMELPHEGSPHWLIYVGTPDVDKSCAQAQALGARALKEPADIPGVGRFAVLADPQGAPFALFTPGPGQPAPTEPEQGGFSWHELATTDVAGALRFYGELFGWRKGPGHDMGTAGVYQIFEHGGKAVGGMCRPGAAHTAPSWLSYVHVADSSRGVSAAKSAGGRLVHGPMEVPGGSWIALLIDPQGSSFAIQELPRVGAAKPAAAKPAAVKPAATPKATAAPAPAAARPAAQPKTAVTSAKSAPAPQKAPVKAPAKAAKKPAKSAKKAGRKRPVRKAARKTRKPARKPARKAARKSARRSARRASPRRRGRRR
jgi:predicted enzyme related to lactoylglutathione lyase